MLSICILWGFSVTACTQTHAVPYLSHYSHMLYYINVSGFAKRDHLGRTSDFELGIWRESTSDELPFALYCAVLACSVAEICLRKAWNGKKYVFEKTAQNIYIR